MIFRLRFAGKCLFLQLFIVLFQMGLFFWVVEETKSVLIALITFFFSLFFNELLFVRYNINYDFVNFIAFGNSAFSKLIKLWFYNFKQRWILLMLYAPLFWICKMYIVSEDVNTLCFVNILLTFIIHVQYTVLIQFLMRRKTLFYFLFKNITVIVYVIMILINLKVDIGVYLNSATLIFTQSLLVIISIPVIYFIFKMIKRKRPFGNICVVDNFLKNKEV